MNTSLNFSTKLLLLCSLLLLLYHGQAQSKTWSYPLRYAAGLQAVHVTVEAATYLGKKAIRVDDRLKEAGASEASFVKLDDLVFHNGTIELEMAGQPMTTAGETARGFVGLAFRIAQDNSRFECFYLRPTNGRANDQVRRNHSVQYTSFPDHPWHRLRKEAPEKYETYADLEPGRWTRVKIVVKDSTAKLYVLEATQPTLLVTDLKLGSETKGSLGLWIGPGTEAYFRNLVVTQEEE